MADEQILSTVNQLQTSRMRSCRNPILELCEQLDLVNWSWRFIPQANRSHAHLTKRPALVKILDSATLLSDVLCSSYATKLKINWLNELLSDGIHHVCACQHVERGIGIYVGAFYPEDIQHTKRSIQQNQQTYIKGNTLNTGRDLEGVLLHVAFRRSSSWRWIRKEKDET